jgi:hypothetical protein
MLPRTQRKETYVAYSSILGGESAPQHPDGRTAGLLGPSDSSDSGSDSLGELGPEELGSDSDRYGTGERASVDMTMDGRSPDLLPDHVGRMDESGGITDDGDAIDALDADALAADDLSDLDLDPDDTDADAA